MTKEKKIEVYIEMVRTRNDLARIGMNGLESQSDKSTFLADIDRKPSPRQQCEELFGFTFPLEDDPPEKPLASNIRLSDEDLMNQVLAHPNEAELQGG